MGQSKHRNPDHQVWAVPHNGRRSLKQHLKAKYPRIEGYHFGQHTGWATAGTIHVPIRHPYDVIRSWVTRAKHNPQHRPTKYIINDYEKMVETLQNHNNVVMYDMESIPIRKGELAEHYPGVEYEDCDEEWQLFLRWLRRDEAARTIFGMLVEHNGSW